MKRKILAAIMAVAMVAGVFAMSVSASDPSTAPSSDVVNSDVNLFKAAGFDVSFEDGTYSPEGWTQGSVSSDYAHSGDKSFLKKDSWGTGGHITIPNVGIEKGKNYVLSFWYYWDGSTQGNATGFLRENGNTGAAITGVTGTKAVREGEEDSLIWFSGDDDGIWTGKNVGTWIYVERGIAAEKDIMTVCVSFTGQNPYYIDDLCLMEASAVPTPEPVEPTPEPVEPTVAPTVAPTEAPTVTPSTSPSTSPSVEPNPPAPKKVKISFKKKTYKVKKGKKVTVKINLKNAKSAKFSVDKKGKKLVKLSKKKAKSVVVTGKKKGTAKLTATAKGKKATCKVKVK